MRTETFHDGVTAVLKPQDLAQQAVIVIDKLFTAESFSFQPCGICQASWVSRLTIPRVLRVKTFLSLGWRTKRMLSVLV